VWQIYIISPMCIYNICSRNDHRHLKRDHISRSSRSRSRSPHRKYHK